VDDAAAEIRYVVSGNESKPDSSSARYDKPVQLAESCVVTAVAIRDGAVSEPSVVNFERIFGIKGVALGRTPHEGYAAQGPLSLVDGKWGNPDSRDRSWLGFSRDGLEAVIDFGSSREVHKAGIDVYEDEKAWIRLPVEVDFLFSEDGKTYREAGRLTEKDILKALTKEDAASGPVRLLAREFKPVKARFLMVRAKNVGYCPAGSPGEGEKAWLFVDEIIVE
jgi:hexosaminidase